MLTGTITQYTENSTKGPEDTIAPEGYSERTVGLLRFLEMIQEDPDSECLLPPTVLELFKDEDLTQIKVKSKTRFGSTFRYISVSAPARLWKIAESAWKNNESIIF